MYIYVSFCDLNVNNDCSVDKVCNIQNYKHLKLLQIVSFCSFGIFYNLFHIYNLQRYSILNKNKNTLKSNQTQNRKAF